MRRYFETLRHLRAGQLVGQVKVRLQREWRRRYAPSTTLAPPFPGLAKALPITLGLAPRPPCDPSLLVRGELSFLGHAVRLGWPPQWNPPDTARLWLYNLHYHDYLWDLPGAEARRLIRSWIADNPLAANGPGWEPYPTSLRLMNWCLALVERRLVANQEGDFAAEIWSSVHQQATWLDRHIEAHLGGNHVLENAAALFLVGSCFAGAAAEHWRRRGWRILETELKEQILEDGLHYERSPMYHLRACWLVATLLPFASGSASDQLNRERERMRAALAKLCHPDGDIALFNDSAFGIYLDPRKLVAPIGPGDGPFALADSGYFGFRHGGDYLICDYGAIGPDHQPGHAHGDTFSFELSIHGQRVVVDSGVHDYESGATRRYTRSTAAHNTVTIEDQDQCEFWGAFRVARRAHVHDVHWQPSTDGFLLEGWHDGYRRLAGAPVHTRSTRAAPREIAIDDRVHATRPVAVASRIHLDPACEIESRRDAVIVLRRSPDVRCRIAFTGNGALTVEDSAYHPEFGRTLPRRVLVYRDHGSDVRMGCRIEWGESSA